MKGFVKWIEEILIAITFSEVGEYAIAQEFLPAPVASTRNGLPAQTHLPTRTSFLPEVDS